MAGRLNHYTRVPNWIAGGGLLILGLFLVGPVGAVEPPEPSYQERWMAKDSSPFFDLRNEVEEPQPPDTPAQPGGANGSPTETPTGEPGGKNDDSAEEADTPAQPAGEPDTIPERETDTETRRTPTGSPSDAVDGPGDRSGVSGTRKPGPLKPLDPEPASFGTFQPIDRDTVPVALPRGEPGSYDTAGVGVVKARGDARASPYAGLIRDWGGWISLVLLGVSAGLIGWGYHSRRVRVIQSSPSGIPLRKDGPDRGARARPEMGDESRENRSATARNDSDQTEPGPKPNRSASVPLWNWDDATLEDRGIDPQYRPILKMYYSEQKPQEKIAQTTEFDPGEIGLVLDMADRLEEEQSHGTGA